MEQFDHIHLTGDSQAQPAGIVGFDVLRTIVAARQSASPTAIALSARVGSAAAPVGAAEAGTLIDIFARGHGQASHSGSFASDEAVIRQDERHA